MKEVSLFSLCFSVAKLLQSGVGTTTTCVKLKRLLDHNPLHFMLYLFDLLLFSVWFNEHFISQHHHSLIPLLFCCGILLIQLCVCVFNVIQTHMRLQSYQNLIKSVLFYIQGFHHEVCHADVASLTKCYALSWQPGVSEHCYKVKQSSVHQVDTIAK